MSEEQKVDAENTENGFFHLPPGALALVVPWMTDRRTSQYVGMPSDPRLVQCTEMAELERSVPVVCNRFLSTSDTIFYQEDDFGAQPTAALSDEAFNMHEHRHFHEHNGTVAGTVADGLVQVDKDNSGSSRTFATVEHSHTVWLKATGVSYGEENRRREFEPLHYEVSAWWVRDEGVPTKVPAGMIAFGKENHETLPGWIRLDREPLGKDPRDPDRDYTPQKWNGETIKIVGCTPQKGRQGSLTHEHEVFEHNHRVHEVETTTDTRVEDAPSAYEDTVPAAPYNHGHNATVSPTRGEIESAENMRKNRRAVIWVATETGVPVHEGLMIPYIPANKVSRDSLISYASGKWVAVRDEEAREYNPTFVTAFKYGDPASLLWRKVQGSNTHAHLVRHSHQVSFSKPTPRSTTGDDEEEAPVAGEYHQHPSITIHHEDWTDEGINVLPYRRMEFIIAVHSN